ncbi:MAG: peptidoglycan-binding protein, partial [Acidobacteria bacterium]|nr:peptidoglycan-binding protein [Acidobacteriota bacterium]
MRKKETTYLFIFTLIVALTIASTALAQSTVREALRDRVKKLSSIPNPVVDGAPIAAAPLISALCERRGYEPAWTDPEMVRELLDQVLRVVDHGLSPDDFHARQLAARLSPGRRASDPGFAADSEILCTDALARLAVTLRFGKLDPADRDPAWNFSRKIAAEDPVEVFNQVLETGNVAKALATAGPQNEIYRWFQTALAKYRSILAKGGWPTVAAGPVLKVGSNGPRVATLRERLRATGDLSGPAPVDRALFDEGLDNAAKNFQMRHGIDADGKVGPRSIEALNVPVEDRIDQIRANLERMRWVFRDLPDDYLIVDIAGFHVYLIEEGRQIWSTRV